MQKDAHVFYFRGMPWALVGAILLSLLFQQVVREMPAFWRFCYLYSNSYTDDLLRVEAQLNMIPGNDRRPRVFILGSSCAKRAFDVNYLTHAFLKEHLSFYNLGIAQAGSSINVLMQKRMWLEKNPAMVIYMLKPYNFYQEEYKFDDARSFDPSVLPVLVKYLGYQRFFSRWTVFVRFYLKEISLFYKYSNFFSRSIMQVGMSCLTGKKMPRSELYPRDRYLPQAYLLDRINRMSEAEVAQFKENKYSALNKECFCLFAKDLVARGIKLVVVNAPVHPVLNLKVHGNRRFVEKWGSAYDNFLQNQSRKIGFAYVDAESLPDLDETDFADTFHLNQKGRAAFSQFIERYLSGHLPSSAGYKSAD